MGKIPLPHKKSLRTQRSQNEISTQLPVPGRILKINRRLFGRAKTNSFTMRLFGYVICQKKRAIENIAIKKNALFLNKLRKQSTSRFSPRSLLLSPSELFFFKKHLFRLPAIIYPGVLFPYYTRYGYSTEKEKKAGDIIMEHPGRRTRYLFDSLWLSKRSHREEISQG